MPIQVGTLFASLHTIASIAGQYPRSLGDFALADAFLSRRALEPSWIRAEHTAMDQQESVGICATNDNLTGFHRAWVTSGITMDTRQWMSNAGLRRHHCTQILRCSAFLARDTRRFCSFKRMCLLAVSLLRRSVAGQASSTSVASVGVCFVPPCSSELFGF